MRSASPEDRARRFLFKRADYSKRRLVCGDLRGVSQAVVIPVLAEEERLFDTLESLGRNPQAELGRTLVICVVNNRAEPFASPAQIADNQRTLVHLENLVNGRRASIRPDLDFDHLRLALVDASSRGLEIGPRFGVGEGRRIGLDLALSVLTDNEVEGGLLFCLDADTLVEGDYLANVRRHFQVTGCRSAVVDYAHGLPDDPARRNAIVRYELFLRYHELGLRFAGSPYAFPTIGSTIVTQCDAYVAAGGMNRRQAGEDFYFLQELVKTGRVDRVTSTTVHPSARVSDRVPFGTGATIGRHISGVDDGSQVYHPRSYRIVGDWLSLVEHRLDHPASDLLEHAARISTHLKEFLIRNRFPESWPRLQQNAPDLDGLERQFHRWFDGFRTLKLIHYLRDNGLPRQSIFDAIRELIERSAGLDPGMIWDDVASDIRVQEELVGILRRRCAEGFS
jgi:hypothetical protein